MTDAPAPTYPVVLLVEQALSPGDAQRVRSLHDGVEEPVGYHLLLPVEDAAARIESSLGHMGGDLGAGPATAIPPVDVAAVEEEVRGQAEEALARSVAALQAVGAQVVGAATTSESPVDALTEAVGQVRAREVIVLTSPHLVAEFFHADWSSRARRRLDVPVLHLVEHETFDDQAGGGEGVTGM